MAKKKKIEIKCQGATTFSISELNILQGDLKTLSEESYKKLRASIIKHGFSFPFFVWENLEDAQFYLLDGTQRLTTLLRMKEEGYAMPQFPVCLIEAKDENEAKSKLLAAASQYGKISESGLSDFLVGFEFDKNELFSTIDIPALDMSNILEPDDELPLPETVTVSTHERSKVDLDNYQKFQHKCPKCSHEWSDK